LEDDDSWGRPSWAEAPQNEHLSKLLLQSEPHRFSKIRRVVSRTEAIDEKAKTRRIYLRVSTLLAKCLARRFLAEQGKHVSKLSISSSICLRFPVLPLKRQSDFYVSALQPAEEDDA
jgi:hypothetical protein